MTAGARKAGLASLFGAAFDGLTAGRRACRERSVFMRAVAVRPRSSMNRICNTLSKSRASVRSAAFALCSACLAASLSASVMSDRGTR